jgi:hypothetical protein
LATLPFAVTTGRDPELSKANADNGPADGAFNCARFAAPPFGQSFPSEEACPATAEEACPATADEATAVNEETIATVIASLRDMVPFLDVKRLSAPMT